MKRLKNTELSSLVFEGVWREFVGSWVLFLLAGSHGGSRMFILRRLHVWEPATHTSPVQSHHIAGFMAQREGI
jgi:hypothetical protein